MAEERLFDIDRDKDRKYRIRVNENGEEELVIEGFNDEPDADDGDYAENETEAEENLYEVPEPEEDDEEAAILTPEQYEAMLEEKRRKAEEDRRKFEFHLGRANEFYQDKNFSGALQEIELAEEYGADDGGLCKLKLLSLTSDFTDFSGEGVSECAGSVAENCSDEQKSELNLFAEPLTERITELRREVENLRLENEEKRAERAEVFLLRRKRAIKWFLAAAVPFVAFICLFAAFFTVRYTLQDGTYLVIAVVFGALALAAFIALLIASRKLWAAQRNISLNAKNSSTALGRKYEEKSGELEVLRTVRRSFKADF